METRESFIREAGGDTGGMFVLVIMTRHVERGSIEEVAVAIAGYGLKVLQLSLESAGVEPLPAQLDAGTARRMREAFERAGVRIGAVSGTFNVIDPDRHARDENLERFARMEAEGKMTEAGRAKKPADVQPPAERLQSGAPVPPFIVAALRKHPLARAFFETLAPGYRRNYLRFITEPKREETRLRRLEQAIAKLEKGVKQVY